jgi:TonB family protein
MTSSAINIVAYSVQLAVLVAAALAFTSALRLRLPRAALHFWQTVLVAAIVLPLLQPRSESTIAVLRTSPFLATVSAPVAALTREPADVVSWLAIIAALGIALRLGWLAVGCLRLRGILASATPAVALQPLADSLSQAINATAAITLSDDVQTPATIGVRRPVILLPRRILDLPQPVQRAVIAHELLHVRRRDWLQTMFEELWCAVWWFHPAARLLASRLSLSREMVVDEATLRLTRDRRAYAEALLAFATPQPHLPGVTPLIGRRHLSQRISLIAEEEVMSRHRLLASFVIAVLVCGAVTASAVSVVPMSARVEQHTTVYKPGNGVTLPAVVAEVKPKYTPEAMKQKIQGTVWMDVVVLETGDVGDVTISKSLDAEYGLDQEAIKAAKQWKFKPGTKEGKPVAVAVVIEMAFTLKK